jgi:alpha/beta superfamily hydrolase
MSTPAWIGQDPTRLFAVRHAPNGPARAGVLVCPPILHEYVRSHRLFAQLGEALAALGFAVLRFDYLGCGDSQGSDESFSMSQAVRDASAAARHLRSQFPAIPVIALGVRAGAFVAAQLLRTREAERLWLWQPLLDGADYVDRLRERQAIELQSPMRYAMARTVRDGDADTLMGYPCTAELAAELQQSRWSDAGLDASQVTLLDRAASAGGPAHARRLELPDALSAWVDELDMARVAGPPITALAAQLAAEGLHR